MRYSAKLIPLLVLVGLFFSFPVLAEDNPIEAEIARSVDAATSPQKIDGIKLNWKRLQEFYVARQFKPCWLNTPILHMQPFTAQAKQFAEALEHAHEDGLLPQAYAAIQLTERVKASAGAHEDLMTELLLSDRAMQYISDLKTGRFSPKKIVPDIILPPRNVDIPALLTQALAANDVSGTLRSFAPSHSEYAALRKKLAEYLVIAAAGGWPQLPAGATLKHGMDDPRIPALYERLRR